jgi:hypothetical protein
VTIVRIQDNYLSAVGAVANASQNLDAAKEQESKSQHRFLKHLIHALEKRNEYDIESRIDETKSHISNAIAEAKDDSNGRIKTLMEKVDTVIDELTTLIKFHNGMTGTAMKNPGY